MVNDQKATYQKAILGASIAYAAFWIAAFLPFSMHISILIGGAIGIFAVETVFRKTGFLIL